MLHNCLQWTKCLRSLPGAHHMPASHAHSLHALLHRPLQFHQRIRTGSMHSNDKFHPMYCEGLEQAADGSFTYTGQASEYKLDTETKGSTGFRNPRAQGCSARATHTHMRTHTHPTPSTSVSCGCVVCVCVCVFACVGVHVSACVACIMNTVNAVTPLHGGMIAMIIHSHVYT